MPTWDDVRRIALAIDGATEGGGGDGFERDGKGFAWAWKERIHPKKARVPNRGVLAVRTAGLVEKEDLLALDPAVFFTEPHYNGYPAVLVRLEVVQMDVLEALIAESHACQRPKRKRVRPAGSRAGS